MYKRDEDGIVLVDQNKCRSWRFCISGCPYKKVYFNWKTKKAEKCMLCYPRVEEGLPTVCSETCVGRIRYMGVMLYDADKVAEVASEPDEKKLYEKQLSIFLDPFDETIIQEAKKSGIGDDILEYAQRSPIYKLAVEEKIAFPLHPEYRTMPMVWYVPPLSPMMSHIEGKDSMLNSEAIFPAIKEMRIPMHYLANMLTAGNTAVIEKALIKRAMMRLFMREESKGNQFDLEKLSSADLTPERAKSLYRLLGIAKYKDRYVIPKAHRERSLREPETAHGAVGYEGCGGCSISALKGTMQTQAQDGTSGKQMYGNLFDGGMWRE
jgi:nitrate reductase beta subunit